MDCESSGRRVHLAHEYQMPTTTATNGPSASQLVSWLSQRTTKGSGKQATSMMTRDRRRPRAASAASSASRWPRRSNVSSGSMSDLQVGNGGGGIVEDSL